MSVIRVFNKDGLKCSFSNITVYITVEICISVAPVDMK